MVYVIYTNRNIGHILTAKGKSANIKSSYNSHDMIGHTTQLKNYQNN